MRLVVLALAATLSVAGAPVAAQPGAPTPQSIALAKRMLNATGVEQQMISMFDDAGHLFLPPQALTDPRFKPEWRVALLEASSEAGKAMLPGLLDRFAVEYAKTFTEEELAAAIAFYDSPAGRAFATKQPSMMAALPKIVEEFSAPTTADLLERFCRKAPDACQNGKPPDLRSSALPATPTLG